MVSDVFSSTGISVPAVGGSSGGNGASQQTGSAGSSAMQQPTSFLGQLSNTGSNLAGQASGLASSAVQAASAVPTQAASSVGSALSGLFDGYAAELAKRDGYHYEQLKNTNTNTNHHQSFANPGGYGAQNTNIGSNNNNLQGTLKTIDVDRYRRGYTGSDQVDSEYERAKAFLTKRVNDARSVKRIKKSGRSKIRRSTGKIGRRTKTSTKSLSKRKSTKTKSRSPAGRSTLKKRSRRG